MSRLPFEAFLALRYLRPRRTFVSVITLISIIGVLLGVAVLIVVIAVMSGFDRQWRDCILGFNAHLKVYPAERGGSVDQLPGHRANHRQKSRCHRRFAFHSLAGSAQNGAGHRQAQTVPARIGRRGPGQRRHCQHSAPQHGGGGALRWSDNGLVSGGILPAGWGWSRRTAWRSIPPAAVEKMQAIAGKTNAEETVLPLPEEFTVRGIFDVGFPDYNSSVIVASLEDARELQSLPEKIRVQGLQVKLRDPFLADKVRRNWKRCCSEGDWPSRPGREEVPGHFQRAGGGKEHDVLPAVFHHDRGRALGSSIARSPLSSRKRARSASSRRSARAGGKFSGCS